MTAGPKGDEWLFFAEDWGRLPSTAQHLVAAMGQGDRVVWVDSIGMRIPSLNAKDVRRAFGKLTQSVTLAVGQPPARPACQFERISPLILPLHKSLAIRRLNAIRLGQRVARLRAKLSMQSPPLVISNPVAAYYAGCVGRVGRKIYLRLDDYAELPGTDPDLVRSAESLVFQTFDCVVATAQSLLPGSAFRGLTTLLPPGVNMEQFKPVSAKPPRARVLGFFGSIESWLDYDLIRRVAQALSDWTLEFVGPRRCAGLDGMPPNVVEKPPVSLSELAVAAKGWDAGWIPFLVNQLTKGVNPLKAREYLSLGLPVLSTEMPELRGLPEVRVLRRGEDAAAIIRALAADDTEKARLARRESVREHSWGARLSVLRDLAFDARGPRAAGRR